MSTRDTTRRAGVRRSASVRAAVEELECDFLVIGSGIAGLWSALRLADHGRVLVVTKKDEAESNTNLAQGGIAAVVSQWDSVEAHVRDTLAVGAGLAKPRIVRDVVRAGPSMVAALIDVGVRFTFKGASESLRHLDLGLEGGHSAPRVVHAADLTGQEIESALVKAVSEHPQVTLLVHHLGIDLILASFRGRPRCTGAWVFDRRKRQIRRILAPVTVLATGGAGQVYRYTTNPEIATGDGVAMAFRAGGRVANMEFVQFHPTRLCLPGAGRFLVSEALRGAGGILRNARGEAFMKRVHPLADLAPRDVVARAIVAECRRTRMRYAYLDMTHLKPQFLHERFPNIDRRCRSLGIDMTREPIPVIPAAHYMCGGVMTDRWARTDLDGLWAAGEVASSGLHGANRLASNSLLEAMFFANAAAESAAKAYQRLRRSLPTAGSAAPPPPVGAHVTARREWALLRDIMWNSVGIIRDRAGLLAAMAVLRGLCRDAERRFLRIGANADTIEFRNASLVGKLIARSALERRESRGLHERTDWPKRDDDKWRHDTILLVRSR
ncbi:MAG: L-aspartate oxidase [candidate division Zixibacteria bacterium]|nr:L-aspartate oxidase [candidate division Zixibacteria bacterium]